MQTNTNSQRDAVADQPDNWTKPATLPALRRANGTFAPGGPSANPGGRPREIADVRALARQHTPMALGTLVEIAQDPRAPAAARVAAANAILDRGWGKRLAKALRRALVASAPYRGRLCDKWRRSHWSISPPKVRRPLAAIAFAAASLRSWAGFFPCATLPITVAAAFLAWAREIAAQEPNGSRSLRPSIVYWTRYERAPPWATLDAMRCIAAFSVVSHHFNTVLPPDEIGRLGLTMPNSYLGVDFFYMLSGFVLARAYERKLKGDLTVWRFMELRLIRLYPMFLLGMLLGAVNAFGRIAFQTPHALDPVQVVFAFVLNSFMVPDPASGNLYTLNMPAWTLLFEMLINFLFGLALFRMRGTLLAAFALACACFYLWGHARLNDGSIGMTWPTALFGFARTGYAFPVGLILGRAFSGRIPRSSPLAVVLLLLLAWIFFLGPPLRFNFAFDVASLFLLLPAIIWAGAHFQAPPTLRRACEIMGDGSYPLFVIHFPLLHIVFFVFARHFGLPSWLVVLGFLPGGFLLALIIFHKVDVPVRSWLSVRSNRRPTAMPVTP